MFKRIIRYYKYPEFKPFTNDVIDIVSRYIYAQPYISSEKICGITFVIEEESKLNNYEDSHILIKQLFIKEFKLSDLPNDTHIVMQGLCLDQINGTSSQIFVESLFYDLIIRTNCQIIKQYFPDWTPELIKSKNDLTNQLIELQKDIENVKSK